MKKISKVEFINKLLKKYAREYLVTVRSTSDLSPLESWLIWLLWQMVDRPEKNADRLIEFITKGE